MVTLSSHRRCARYRHLPRRSVFRRHLPLRHPPGLALAAVAQRKDLRCQCRGVLDSFGACAMVRLAGSGNESARNAMMITGEVTFSPLSGLLT